MTEKRTEKNTVIVNFEGDIPEHDGQKYHSLTLRKMKARDLVAADLVTGGSRKGFAILASMAGVPVQVIEALDIDDFDMLSEKAAPLMGKLGESLTTALAAARDEAPASL